MKISERYHLNKTQFELDFVDINTNKDTRLFLDPYFISKCTFPFAQEAHEKIRTYFEYLLALLRARKLTMAQNIFSYLGETNDVCLGLSRGRPQGHGMGPSDTDAIFEQLLKSRAIETGVLEDIEDFRIFVPNVGKDKVSDMTANIIRENLIEYTQQQCQLLGIPLTNVPSQYYWDSHTKSWQNDYTERLVIDRKPILLVPKRIVSFSDKYTPDEYKQQYVLEYLRNEYEKFQAPSIGGRKKPKRISKKAIEQREGGISKEYLVQFTEHHPEIFAHFKEQTSRKIRPVTGAGDQEGLNVSNICTFLGNELRNLPGGQAQASAYHTLMIGILELLFYPALSSPKKELEINDGRKRIDIVFNNSADAGFFYSLPNSAKLPCPFVFVECKNYTREIANPELDQIAGRFHYQRGRFGIIVCRSIEDMTLFMKRCSDTYLAGNGLIIPLVDADFLDALTHYPTEGNGFIENILQNKFRMIASG